MKRRFDRDAIAEALEMIPLIGKFLAWILRHLGAQVFAGLLLGTLLSGVLISLGYWPKDLISSEYLQATRRTAIELAEPVSVELAFKPPDPLLITHPLWAYAQYLHDEAEAEKASGKISGFDTSVAQSEPLSATRAFEWRLTSSPPYEIFGRAYRIWEEDSSTCIEPLKFSWLSGSKDGIGFFVPPFEGSYSLVLLAKVTTSKGLPVPAELDKVITSRIHH